MIRNEKITAKGGLAFPGVVSAPALATDGSGNVKLADKVVFDSRVTAPSALSATVNESTTPATITGAGSFYVNSTDHLPHFLDHSGTDNALLAYSSTSNTGTATRVYGVGITLADTDTIIAGTSGGAGVKIGTAGGAAGQKLGFFNATPVVQQLLATGAGHTVDDVITVLQTLGLARQT